MRMQALGELAAGLGAGYAATKALDRTSSWFYARQSEESRRREEQLRDDLPTIELVRKVASWRGVKLDEDGERQLARFVHFGLGASGGPAAQLLARRTGLGLLASGAVTGMAIFLFVDEGANYVLGLTAPAPEWPAVTHARGLVAHAVYGVALGSLLAIANRVGFRR